MNTIKHKTIILFSLALLAIVMITFNGCSAITTGTGSHHQKGNISTH